MTHTFLFQQGTWNVAGYYTDAEGQKNPIKGSARIVHQDRQWQLSGLIAILSDPPITIENDLTFEPVSPGGLHTRWKSENHSFGPLEGMIVVVDDSILSTFESGDGIHKGMECFRKLTNTHYTNRGALFSGNTRVSSWIVELHLSGTISHQMI